MKSILKSKKILLTALIITFIMAGIITTVKITGSNALRTTAKQLSLGEKYLSELKYDKAIVAFNKVIEIEPRNMQAYLGLAEAYQGLDQIDNSISTLVTAIEIAKYEYETNDTVLDSSVNLYVKLYKSYIEIGNLRKHIILYKKVII